MQRGLYFLAVFVATFRPLQADPVILLPNECDISVQPSQQTTRAEYLYRPTSKKEKSLLWVQAEMADGEQASISFVNTITKERWRQVAQAHDMLVTWWLQDLPPGTYRLAFHLPKIYTQPAEIFVRLAPGETLELSPQFTEKTKP